MILRKIPIVLLPVLLFSCVAVPTTNKVKNENIVMGIHKADPELLAWDLKSQNIVAINDPSRGTESAWTLIAGTGVTLMAEGVKKLITIDSKKYNAQFTGVKNVFPFYNQVSNKGALDPHGIIFEGIHLTRYYGETKDKHVKAFYISLKVDKSDQFELINNSFFHLKLDEFVLPFAKCKIPDKRGYMPWTWFNKKKKLNLDIDVIIKSSWMTHQGVFYDNVEIGHFNTQLRDFPLDTLGQRKVINDIKKTSEAKLDGYSMLVPRSFGYYYSETGELKECYGQGLYSVTVNVKESTKPPTVPRYLEEHSGFIIDSTTKNYPINIK